MQSKQTQKKICFSNILVLIFMKEEEGIRSWSKTTYPVLKELLFLNIHFKSRLIILDLMAYDFLSSPLTSPSIFFVSPPAALVSFHEAAVSGRKIWPGSRTAHSDPSSAYSASYVRKTTPLCTTDVLMQE
jgi:hypothetical protein